MRPDPDLPSNGRLLTVLREDLHAMVWREPITKVAARFGISDVALRKKCVQHSIPVPARGYWRQIETGGHPMPAELPEVVGAGGIDFWVPVDRQATETPAAFDRSRTSSRAVRTRADYRLDGERRQEERRHRLEVIEREHAQARERVAEERKALAKLEADAIAWEQAQRLRAYIAAVVKVHAPTRSPADIVEWCEWATTHADHIDPLTSRDARDRTTFKQH
ncbi:hypothetical protein [Sphingomonas sp.]|uniref:hypothetical protein n=1 Tax=Sphingomonas sp. TaxID=28214 RepID=UPI003D6D660F